MPRQRLAVLDAAIDERVLAVLTQRCVPEALGEAGGKERVGLHAVHMGDACAVEIIQLIACSRAKVQDYAVG